MLAAIPLTSAQLLFFFFALLVWFLSSFEFITPNIGINNSWVISDHKFFTFLVPTYVLFLSCTFKVGILISVVNQFTTACIEDGKEGSEILYLFYTNETITFSFLQPWFCLPNVQCPRLSYLI